VLPDAISLNKAAIIERCLRRMHQEYKADPALENYTHLDALVLNIERACQAAIDLAMHVVSESHLGVPQSSAEAFVLLREADRLEANLAQRMTKMAGFRNIVVHQYQDLDTDVIHHIMQKGWEDFIAFCQALGLKIKVIGIQETLKG